MTIPSLFGDNSMRAVEIALDAVAERQRVTSHNIANVNTPGFRSSRVAFEDQLSRALQRGDLDDVGFSKVAAGTPINTRGNDVALEQETADLIRSGIHYEALVNTLNHRFTVLRTAITGR